jgi:antirestriction protein ArdC
MPSATKTKIRKSMNAIRDSYADVTARVLEQLEQGTVIWHQRWHTSLSNSAPTNLDSGKLYRGINVFLLQLEAMEKGYGSNRWATYKQITDRGGQVRKGEKSVQVVFWKILRKEVEVDGEAKTKRIPMLRTFNVFNEEQADWNPETDRRRAVSERVTVDPVESAEALLADYLATGPSLVHGGARACYRPAMDRIHMPERDDFESADHYYSTLFHEVTHSTGHTKRLARQGIAEGTFGAFGDPVYSFEELVAEMGAAMLCAAADIDLAAVIPDSAAYLAHWRDALKGDNKLIIQAAAAAQKAVDLVVGTSFPDEDES